jgi:hypothetical protein
VDLQGGGPRERLLALQVVSVPELAPHFASAIDHLAAQGDSRLSRLAAALQERIPLLPVQTLEPLTLAGENLDQLERLDRALIDLLGGSAEALPEAAALLSEVYHAQAHPHAELAA